jgi:hypothetical protein
MLWHHDTPFLSFAHKHTYALTQTDTHARTHEIEHALLSQNRPKRNLRNLIFSVDSEINLKLSRNLSNFILSIPVSHKRSHSYGFVTPLLLISNFSIMPISYHFLIILMFLCSIPSTLYNFGSYFSILHFITCPSEKNSYRYFQADSS